MYKADYFISANEGNPEGELALTILTSHIIEVATSHANELGIGNPTMDHLGAGWVLSRLSAEVSYYPKVNTSYSISTWVESWNRHYSVRCFEFTDNEGNVFGYARSIWMVLNTVTHENFGLGHLTLPEEAIEARECPIARQARHVEIISPDMDSLVTTPYVVASVPPVHYTFKYNDMDYYRHVNTVRYVALLLNQYTLDEFDKSYVNRMELSFLHEGKYGNTVSIWRHDNAKSGMSDFSLFDDNENQPVLFARIRLLPRQ